MFFYITPPLSSSLFLVLFLCINGDSATKIGNGYRLISVTESDRGLIGHLQVKQKNNIYGPDLPHLQLYVKHETENRLRVHITDAEKERWEVPYNLLRREKPSPIKQTIRRSRKNVLLSESKYAGSSELVFSYTPNPFGFAVSRKSNGDTLFNSSSVQTDPYSNLVFKDQYLEISTKLPKDASLYGLGENTQPHGIKLYPNDPYTLYTTDASPVYLNKDLYGSHPIYMDLRNTSNGAYAHGVLLLNSNGMDVVYRGDSLTYKVIGGIFDFYFFSGPTPLTVVDQYTAFIGRPAAMPYWALGFHQCKFGYHNLSVVEDVVENYKKAEIPLDVIWNDDDHMDGHKDFTLNPKNYPRSKLLAFLKKIHKRGMKFIVLVDPGIDVNSSYGVYKRGLAKDVFIKYQGKPYLAQVWPGAVNFPDFLNPETVDWWGDEIKRFHELVPVDGLWIDMNEVSNFCTGLCTIPEGKQCPNESKSAWICCLDCKNVTKTKWDDPPYKINVSGIQRPIGSNTIATSATHYNGVLEYDAHSLYGFSQAIATHKALQGLEGKRPFILTRSTYVGSGHYAAHWTGDNRGTWESMKYSISSMLNFGIFGIPMVGSDICGFFSGPTDEPIEELCNRWIELGAFYPFSRDHANFDSPRQELYLWKSVARSARNALGMRYKLLPYLYTLSYEAHKTGAPIAQPLFFSFPNFTDCYTVSTQFLLGSSLMVSPVLEKGKSKVKAIFPPGTWYNMFNLTESVVSTIGRHYLTLDAPLHVINVHVYQNTIIPMQRGGLTSKEARTTPFSLVVTFPSGSTEGNAEGKLYIDDDKLPDMKLGSEFSSYIELYGSVGQGEVKVWSKVEDGKFALGKGWIIERILVLGLSGNGSSKSISIEIDGVASIDTTNVEFVETEHKNIEILEGGNRKNSRMVEVKGLKIPIGKKFSLSWKMGIS